MPATKRIKQIITILMDPRSDESRDPGALYNELEEMGYTYAEIDQALDMLDYEPIPANRIEATLRGDRNRILGEAEKNILSIKAQGYLLTMLGTGHISESQLSAILDSATLEYSPPLSLYEIREISTRYIPDLPDYDPSHSTRGNGQVH